VAGTAIDADGNISVADCDRSAIHTFAPDGTFLRSWGSYGWGDGDLGYPVDVAIDTAGRFWVVDAGHSSIQVFDKDGSFLAQFGRTGANPATGFSGVWALALDGRGNLYVTDWKLDIVVAFRIEPPLAP
jgi:DNA-binding beta-propeller fold protein YncE